MSKAVVLTSPVQQTNAPAAQVAAAGGEISEGKLQQMYRESLAAFSQGVMFGWKADMYKALALFNIQFNKLHELDGIDWKSFLDSLQISDRSVQRYMRIAERIREVIKSSGVASTLPRYITQKDFNTAFEPFFANGKQVTLRGLATASKDLTTFQAYLSGDESYQDKDAIKLLNAKNKKTQEQKDREEREAKIVAEMDASMDSFYRSEAATRGYRWNGEAYENPDGEPLTDKQLSEFTNAVEALKVWSRTEDVLADAKNKVEHALHAYGDTYRRYRKHTADNNFQTKVNEKCRVALTLLERIDSMVRDLHSGDAA